MIVYHGSTIEVSRPDILHSREKVDFGRGFYTTPLYEQAENWCRRFKYAGKCGIISKYVLDENSAAGFHTLKFDSYSEEWLDFVLACRTGQDVSAYDIIAGGVANDKVFNTVELYFDQLIDKGEAIRRLKFEKPNLQICFRSQAALDRCLMFERSVRI